MTERSRGHIIDAVPAVILSLELAPCLLLLGTDTATLTLEFWGLLVFQEASAVFTKYRRVH